MSLVKYELKKIFLKKLFVICLVVFFAANIFTLLYSQSADYEVNTLVENKADYEQMIESLDGMSTQQMQSELNSMLKVTQIALNLDALANGDDRDEDYLEDVEEEINRCKSESPKEYKQAKKLNMSNQELKNRYSFIENLTNQANYIAQYGDFIDNMQEQADYQLKFSIFAEEGSFSYNNIKKTPSDFESLKGIDLKIGNNIALEKSTTFVLTDLLVFALVFLLCIYAFTYERDKQLYTLIRTTRRGYLPLIRSKLVSVLICTAVISALYYASNFIASGMYSGFGDLTRNIQSSEMFMNCNLNLQIWQYLALWVISKVITMCAIALVLAVVFVLIKNTALIFAVSLLALAEQWATYAFIASSSPISFFKYANLIYFLSGNNSFGYYLNVDIFSQPVNIVTVYIAAVIVIFIAATAVVCVSFVRKNQTSSLNVLSVLTEKVRTKFGRISGNVSVVRGEWYKHCRGSLALAVVALLVLFAYGNLTDDITITYSSAADSAYTAYMNELEGEYTEEKEQYIASQQEYFDDLNNQIATITADDSLSSSEKETKLTAIQSILDTKGEAFSQILEQAEYIKQMGEEYGITPEFINYSVYEKLTENPGREWQYFTLLLLVMILLSSNSFAYEHKKEMSNLIRCTRKGKARLIISKIFVVAVTAAVSYVLIYLPYYINFINTFGTTSFDTPIIFMQDFSGINSTMSINNMIFVTSAVHIAAATAAMMLTIMFSQLFKSNIISMIVASAVMLFPCLLFMSSQEVRLYVSFQSGSWQWLVPLLVLSALAVAVACAVVLGLSFSNCKIRRKSNAES